MSHSKQVVTMSYSTIASSLRGLAKVSFAAGILLLGLSVSGAQAATVTVYSENEAGWTGAAGGPVVTEEFGDAVLEPGFAITLGSELPGTIGGGEYNDRASNGQVQNPIFTFSGLGVTAFGADWNLGPNQPGTGIEFFITFVGGLTMTLTEQILNPIPGLNGTGFVGFFGIVSDMAIASIELREGSQIGAYETFTLDNARFVSAVPIPAALPLFLSALAALGFLGRRKKQLAAA
jgi:hypothetical protein